MNISYHKAPDCISDDNVHSVVYKWNEEDNTRAECEYCGERFYLISKTTIKDAGINLVEREF